MFVLIRSAGRLQGPGPSPTPGIGPGDPSPQQYTDNLYTSTDGEAWTIIGRAPLALRTDLTGAGDVNALMVSSLDPQRIFRGDGTFSKDAGQSWSAPSPALPLGHVRVNNFDIAGGAWLASSQEVLWISTDRGRTWQAVVGGDDFFFNAIQGAWHVPTGRTILAHYFPARVTGGPGGHFERMPVMMRSTDGGANWRPVVAPDTRGYRARFAVVGQEGSTVYAALSPYYFYGSGSETSRQMDGALLKSTDTGASWITLTVGMVVNNVLIDPADPRHLWAAGDDGLAESRDAGATWQPIRTNLQVGGLVYSEPGSSSVLYAYGAGGYRPQGPQQGGGVVKGQMHKSTDGGRTWAKLAITGAPADYKVQTYAVGRQGQLVVAWYGGSQSTGAPTISESVDGGRTWRALTGLGLNNYFGEELAVDTVGGAIYASGCCGRLRSFNAVADGSNPAFNALWQRQDAPVQQGRASRSWTWGPGPFSTIREALEGLPGNSRLVQYYDKSRMEVNDPNADPASPWFVTNGLLTVEMVAGRVQTGLDRWEPRPPCFLPVAGDAGPSDQPSYASFRGVASYESGNNRAEDRTGQNVTQSIDAAGGIGSDVPTTTARLARYDPEGGHNIAAPFWEFLNRRGPVLENGRLVERPILGDWVFVMGRPITEPYWMRVHVGNRSLWVLVQLFERRVLTYTPSNAPEWQVEMGNVGLHYYLWRYGDQR
jgi:photosystem II stability/assembly factor-like uncharacterized protein